MASINGKKVRIIHFGSPVGSAWRKTKNLDKKPRKKKEAGDGEAR